jgi:hypothetical protein
MVVIRFSRSLRGITYICGLALPCTSIASMRDHRFHAVWQSLSSHTHIDAVVWLHTLVRGSLARSEHLLPVRIVLTLWRLFVPVECVWVSVCRYVCVSVCLCSMCVCV